METEKTKFNILIAPDKFKGSLSASSLCRRLESALQSVLQNANIVSRPLADGGEGSLEILAMHLDLEMLYCPAVNPLLRDIKASYYRSGNVAYIELARASGYSLLSPSERNPMHTSTYGTGLQIKHALEHDCEHIYLFLGGSATHDGGIGIMNALGYTFLDDNGIELLPVGASLSKIHTIVAPDSIPKIEELKICCDVKNPPYGPNGAAQVYAKQKGASLEEIVQLDGGIQNLCLRLKEFNGIELSEMPGGGAAGGTALSLIGLLDAHIVSGFDLFSKITQLDSKIANADLVISGEGKLDHQSFDGKVVSGIAQYCRIHEKPLYLVVGQNELDKQELERLGIDELWTVLDQAEDLEDAIVQIDEHLFSIAQKIAIKILETKNT